MATVGVLTILAIWDGAASYTQHRLQAQHYAAEYAAEAQERIEQCAALASTADMAECISQVIEATREEQRGERDLAAQRDMAKWAGWLLVASGASVWITLAGVIYVALTLQATREAVAAANRTADEAKRIGEAQVRAYMAITSATIAFTFARETKALCPILRVKFMNSGNSPAKNYEMRIKIAYQQVYKGRVASEVSLLPENWGPITPKDERLHVQRFPDAPLDKDDYAALRAGLGLAVHVNIITRFVDVFDTIIDDAQGFIRLYSTFDETSAELPMMGSPVKIDELVQLGTLRGLFADA